MRDERNFPARKRPPVNEHPRADATLDRERAITEIRRFLDVALREMGLGLTYEISTPPSLEAGREETDVVAMLQGEDQDLLLDKNAELLLALEHIAHRWLRLDPRLHDRVRFDCGNYRSAHLDELKLSARVAAQRVRETGQEFRFNPMPPRERRIMHLELNGASGVRTASEGVGDRRQLVIYPANRK